MILTHTDKATFEPTNVEIDDELIMVAEQLMTGIIHTKPTTPIFPRDLKGKQVSFSIDVGKDKLERDTGKRLYRVIIEKIDQLAENKEVKLPETVTLTSETGQIAHFTLSKKRKFKIGPKNSDFGKLDNNEVFYVTEWGWGIIVDKHTKKVVHGYGKEDHFNGLSIITN